MRTWDWTYQGQCQHCFCEPPNKLYFFSGFLRVVNILINLLRTPVLTCMNDMPHRHQLCRHQRCDNISRHCSTTCTREHVLVLLSAGHIPCIWVDSWRHESKDRSFKDILGPISKTMAMCFLWLISSRVLASSASCSTHVTAAEHFKFSFSGNKFV